MMVQIYKSGIFACFSATLFQIENLQITMPKQNKNLQKCEYLFFFHHLKHTGKHCMFMHYMC